MPPSIISGFLHRFGTAAGRKNSCDLAGFFNRPQKCQHVGVDLIHVRSGKTVRQTARDGGYCFNRRFL